MFVRISGLALFLTLAACGGGGGSVNSTPTSPPPLTNSTMSDLKVSQSFANDAVTGNMSFDLPTGTTISTQDNSGPLSIRYDATSNSYAITAVGRQETFGPGDVVSELGYETQYRKSGDQGNSRLTLVKEPYYHTAPTQYVGMGYLQRSSTNGTRQELEFTSFTYGLETVSASVPRTGTAGFGIDIFGLTARAGYEPRLLQGDGTFTADFAAGEFSASGYLSEMGLVTGSGVSGGGIEFISGGRLSSSSGQFSGNMAYSGSEGVIGGRLNGRFYGPTANELGAAFSGQGTDGATVTGSITGWRDPSAQLANLTLANITMPGFYAPHFALLTSNTGPDGALVDVRTYQGGGQLEYLGSDTFSYGPGLSNLPGGTFGPADKVASANPNYTSYRKTIAGQDLSLDLYKSGPGNTELALTYTTLGRWGTTDVQNGFSEAHKVYFTHGLETDRFLLAAKTGTGSYAGIVEGSGITRESGAQYVIDGTSRFDVNFSQNKLSGALTLSGTRTNGVGNIDFGTYDFSGPLAGLNTDLMRGGTPAGQISSRFYGWDASEIGSVFTMVTPPESPGAGTVISGATVAKQR